MNLTLSGQENNPIGALLLDILVVFVGTNQERIFSRALVEGLNSDEERPWAEMRNGRAITEIWLAQQLRPYGFAQRQIVDIWLTRGLHCGMRTMPEVMLATRRLGTSKTRLPKKWNVRNVTLNSLLKGSEMAPITIIDAGNPKALSDDPKVARTLAKRFEEGPRSSFLVLTFESPATIEPEVKVGLLKPFAHPERVEISEDMRSMPHLVKNLMAKIRVLTEREEDQESPRPSPLDRMKRIISASRDFRVDNGNLSAQAIAKVYGISLNELAGWLGRTRQALTKTPDADSLQPQLAFFERIARLRTVLADDAEFRKWLRMPQHELDDETPLQWIKRKRWQRLADLVDDMLTGAPG